VVNVAATFFFLAIHAIVRFAGVLNALNDTTKGAWEHIMGHAVMQSHFHIKVSRSQRTLQPKNVTAAIVL